MRYVATPVWHNNTLAGVLLAGGITNGKVVATTHFQRKFSILTPFLSTMAQTPITWSTVHAYSGGYAGFYTRSRWGNYVRNSSLDCIDSMIIL